MIQYSDVVFIFDGGTSYTGDILKEAKRQHKQGKIIRIKPIITIPELSDAFVYAATMLYPREELIKIYKWLLLYLNKRNFFANSFSKRFKCVTHFSPPKTKRTPVGFFLHKDFRIMGKSK